jgi:hypothetical protein
MLRGTGSRIRTAALRLARPSLPPLDAYAEELVATWDDAWLSNFGPHAERFERVCSEYTGLPHDQSGNLDAGVARVLGHLEGEAARSGHVDVV